jgi:hypothetical protein
MIYYIFDPLNDNTRLNYDTEIYPDAKELAEAKLAEIQTAYLEQQKLRFHFAIVTLENGGEVWTTGDVNTAPEYGNYRVLNEYTGSYDEFTNLTEVKSEIAIRQQQFLVNCSLDKVHVIKQPVSEGLQNA